jgi:hypothetical protein
MILNPEVLQDIDAEDLRPGVLTYVIPEAPAFKVRINGPNLDISLAVCCPEDIGIIEKLLVKMRASLSAPESP